MKLKTYLIQLCVSIACVVSGSALWANESAQINLRDVDISTLIETVSRITNKSFVIDPRVKGNVTVVTSQDISEDELYETFLSILQVHGFSAVPSGKIIKIVPSNQAKQQPVPVVGEDEIREVDSLYKKSLKKPVKRKADELITRVIRVEHVPAAMLVPILRPLVPSTGQLQAYAPSNTIVISDRAANIERIIEVIKRMDRADDEQIEVVKLRYASAKTLAQTIQKLQQSSVKGVQSKSKVSADERTNSLLISGDKSSRVQVRRIIAQLDTHQKTDERTKVIYLRYAKATEIAKVLTGVSKTQRTAVPTAKGAAGQTRAEVDIQADEASNSLIITAEPEVFANLQKVIKRLDVRRAQVLVEAIIAEVSARLSKDIGTALAASSNQGAVGASGTTASTTTLLSILAGAVPTSVNGGALGLVDNIGNNRFGLLVNALSGDSATNILSTPSIVAMDNEEAEIVVGQNVPFVTGSYTNTGSNSGTNPSNPFQTIERRDVGLTLKIKPQINAGDTINLQIQQEVSSIEESDVSASDLITNKSSITTNVMVQDDQVLILGGLLQDNFRDTINKVPVLGDVPILGNLFRTKGTNKEKQNLMVFIHPVIMRDVLSADGYTREKYNKIRRAQVKSKVTQRGILHEKAKVFPADPRDVLTRKVSPEQANQKFRQQQQRQVQQSGAVRQERIRQAKLREQQAIKERQERLKRKALLEQQQRERNEQRRRQHQLEQQRLQRQRQQRSEIELPEVKAKVVNTTKKVLARKNTQATTHVTKPPVQLRSANKQVYAATNAQTASPRAVTGKTGNASNSKLQAFYERSFQTR